MDNILRQLGFIETQMALFHSLKSGTTQGIQLITLRGDAALDRLEQGVQFLFDKYQGLRCRIRETPEGMFFEEGVQRADIVCETSNLNDWRVNDIYGAVDAELNAPLDPTRALWSARAVRDGSQVHLLIKCHHSIIDGDGFSKLAAALLQYLDGKTLDGGSEPLAPAIDTELRPLPQKSSTQGSVARHFRLAPLNARRTHFRKAKLDVRSSDHIRAFAAEHRLASNSVLAGMLARAFGRVVSLPDPLEFKSAVSLRDGAIQLPNPDLLGCYIGIGSASLVLQEKTLAEVASEYQQRLYRDVLYSTMRRKDVAYPVFREYIETIDAAGVFTHGVGLTNLGALKLPKLDSLRVTEYFTFNNRNAGNVAFVTNALELDGLFHLSFVFCEPLLDFPTIDQVVTEFHREADSLLQ